MLSLLPLRGIANASTLEKSLRGQVWIKPDDLEAARPSPEGQHAASVRRRGEMKTPGKLYRSTRVIHSESLSPFLMVYPEFSSKKHLSGPQYCKHNPERERERGKRERERERERERVGRFSVQVRCNEWSRK